ncbi:hypothetical protein B0H10DRAFT_1955970 [Mycena sp. CBHHK59/15]|nr:hypothetical protein B0H10DRAFT_1955970 [Mycena sp. CBHHK59/15]
MFSKWDQIEARKASEAIGWHRVISDFNASNHEEQYAKLCKANGLLLAAVPIDFGFDLKPAPFPFHPALPSRPAPTLSPSITVVAMSPAVSPTTSTLGLQVVRPASAAWPKSSSRAVSALPIGQDFDKLVRAELTGLLTIWPKSWLPGGPGPTLDPFAIEPGIQGTTSWLPVSTDVWGACQFQAVTTCVTIGGVGEGSNDSRSPLPPFLVAGWTTWNNGVHYTFPSLLTGVK